jgi:CBS domain-containing protein
VIISDLAQATNLRLKSLNEQSSVRVAADAFSDSRLGLIIVCDASDRAEGVVSKSDLVRHLARAGEVDMPITGVMSRSIIYGSQRDDVYDAWERMAAGKLQNLPVLGPDRKPVGMLDIRDALQAILEQEQRQEGQLINYIAGIGYR